MNGTGEEPSRRDEDVRSALSRALFPTGTEPDPRFTLANERTFLAWMRTALAFIAGGVALEALPIDTIPEGFVTPVLWSLSVWESCWRPVLPFVGCGSNARCVNRGPSPHPRSSRRCQSGPSSSPQCSFFWCCCDGAIGVAVEVSDPGGGPRSAA